MDIGIILIVSILVLGGVIATVGDRIGTRVGKARLSLFKLRPRQTAVLVTILTGLSISASTLAILFATSKPFRKGVFQLDQLEAIQTKLKTANKELNQKIAQKNQIQKELASSQAEKIAAQELLDQTNNSLKNAQEKQHKTEKQLNQTQGQLKSVSQQKGVLSSDIKKLEIEREDLRRQRNQVKAEISQLKIENTQLQSELNTAKFQQLEAQQLLNNTNESLRKKQAENTKLERELSKAKSEELAAQKHLDATNESLQKKQAENAQLEVALTKSKAEQVAAEKRLKDINEVLKERQFQNAKLEAKLQDQQNKLASLQADLDNLEQYYGRLRQGNLALIRSQVLASGVVRIVNPNSARQAIDQLLNEANRVALEATFPGNTNIKKQVVQITKIQVNQLANQIKDGQDYVVRIFSAANYLVGEKQVQVFADAIPNQIVFTADKVMATISADPQTMSEEEIRKRVEQLLIVSQFRAQRAGLISDKIQIGDGNVISRVRFIEQIKQYSESLELKAITSEDIYPAGPLKLKLVAIKDGQILFSI